MIQTKNKNKNKTFKLCKEFDKKSEYIFYKFEEIYNDLNKLWKNQKKETLKYMDNVDNILDKSIYSQKGAKSK